jgi:hypothetical protein
MKAKGWLRVGGGAAGPRRAARSISNQPKPVGASGKSICMTYLRDFDFPWTPVHTVFWHNYKYQGSWPLPVMFAILLG